MELKLCGDLLNFLALYLSHRTKILILKLNWRIRKICEHEYLIKLLNNEFVDFGHSRYEIMSKYINDQQRIHMVSCYLFRFKNVYSDKWKNEYVNGQLCGITNRHRQMPNHATHFKMGFFFNSKLNIRTHCPNLKYLYMNDRFDRPIKGLPSSLIYLRLGDDFGNDIDSLCTMTPKLLYLKFSKNSQFNQEIIYLPCKLKFLFLPTSFNKPIRIPQSLEILVLNKNYPLSLNYSSLKIIYY